MSRHRSLVRLLSSGCAFVVLAATAGACGENADRERLQAEQLERAREEGRREAIAEEKVERAANEARRLRREIERIKPGQAKGGGSRSPGTPAPDGGSQGSTGTTRSATTRCEDGLSVNSVTSCSFARNVRDAYEGSGGASSIDVYSPVTQRTYTMRCTGGVPVVCTGGNNAAVYIR